MLFTPALANTDGSPSMLAQFAPLIIIFVIFYFLLIRPQQKRAKQHREKLTAMKVGDKVITSGGIRGKVKKINETDIKVEIAPKIEIEVVKSTIVDVLTK